MTCIERTYDGDGILANVFKPDKFQSAGSETVDTLHLVGTNDDILQRSALFQEEDCIIVA